MDHAYLGPKFTNEQIEVLLNARSDDLTQQDCQTEHVSDEMIVQNDGSSNC